MPCDIGYKSFDRVIVPAPQPLAFRKRISAPTVDAELLERIGQDDPGFVEWVSETDSMPLLKRALEKALAAAGSTGEVAFTVKDGSLFAKATCATAADKRRAEEIADRVGRRFQMEVLAIVAELLDFETSLTSSTQDGEEVLMLEGEKHGTSQVHEYLRVTLDPRQGASVMFEHFASKQDLALVKAKFLALAQKLGVRLSVTDTKESGSPVPAGAVHKHFIKGGK